MSPAKVRPATEADIPALIELGRLMHAESPNHRRHPFVDDDLRVTLRFSIADGQVFVAEDEAALVGVAVGFVSETFYGPAIIGGELAIYVEPGSRGGGLAGVLVKALEARAKDRGAVEMHLGVSTGVATESVEALYRRLGYERCGVLMSRSLVSPDDDG